MKRQVILALCAVTAFAAAAQTKRIIKHNGDLEIECTGNVRIKAANIYLNE